MLVIFDRTLGRHAGMLRLMRLLIAVIAALAVAGVSGEANAQEPVPTADLAIVSITASANHIRVGDVITFTVIAANNGPDAVNSLDVTIRTEPLLANEDEECDPTQGVSADTPSCEYPGGLASSIPPGETLTTTYSGVVPSGSKFVTATACVSSELPINDPNSSNDCASASVKVIGRRKP
jgi:hypothetical protein